MATFIMAMSINPTAKRTHSDLAKQLEDSLGVFKQHDVKLKDLYATMGRYDCLAVFECESQAVAFKVASGINALGILDTETWPVIPFDEFSQLLG